VVGDVELIKRVIIAVRRRKGDETLNRLLNWSDAQKASERLASHILSSEGFKSIDPSHPSGGPDGSKDILCKKNRLLWVGACYFPNGQKPFRDIQEKFLHDAKIISRDKTIKGFIFVTNQKLTLGEREKLKKSIKIHNIEIFHLERITHILNKPENYGIRLEFLDLEMNKEEQISYFTITAKHSISQFQKINNDIYKVLRKIQELSIKKEIKNE
jgi:hypothetical protein